MLRLIALACLVAVACGTEWTKGMEGEMYQGDMDLTPEQVQAAMEGSFSYGSVTYGRWTNAQVPYYIDSRMSSRGKSAIAQAIADYHRYTCIRFVRRSNQRNYIKFYQGGGCHSPVGMQRNGNSISLGNGCHSKGTALHEIGHSLGLFHEQSRPDRNQYVRINLRSLSNPKMAFNFNIQRNINSLGTAYDLRSMMHYSSTAFAKRGYKTITTINSSQQSLIDTYNRISGFSAIDIKQLNLMYCTGRGDEPLTAHH